MQDFNIKRILVTYDFSAAALNAVKTAAAVAKQSNASLILLFAIGDRTHVGIGTGDVAAAGRLQLTKDAIEILETLMDEISSEHKVKVGYRILWGAPAVLVNKYTWEYDVNLIVTYPGWGKDDTAALTDSPFLKLLKIAPCPVLTAPVDKPFIAVRKILFPVRDGSLTPEKYSLIRSIVERKDAAITVVGLAPVGDRKRFTLINSAIQNLEEKMQRDGIRHNAQVRFCESITGELLDILEQEVPDLLVITAKIHSVLKHVFLEYYVRNIARRAQCPVLIMRHDIVKS